MPVETDGKTAEPTSAEPLQAESGGPAAKEPAECANSVAKEEGHCSPPLPGKSVPFLS